MSIAKKLAAVLLCALVIVSAATTVLAYGKAEPKGTEPKTEDVLPPAENTHAIKNSITALASAPSAEEEAPTEDEVGQPEADPQAPAEPEVKPETEIETVPEVKPETAPEAAPSVTPAPQQGWEVSVYLNGEAMPLTIPTMLRSGTTYVSLYDFCTVMGCKVTWLDGYAKVTRGSELEMYCTPGQIYLTANGRALYTPIPAVIVNDRIMIPIRVMASVFDMQVNWDGTINRVNLTGGGLLESGDSYYDADTLYWLSRIISAEARGEPLTGQIAVGNVVFNRIKDPEFPDTVYGVIFDRVNGTQFTPVDDGSVYDSPKYISVIAAKLCLEGADYSCGATYFISDKVTSCWAMSNKTLITTIGGHRFYG